MKDLNNSSLRKKIRSAVVFIHVIIDVTCTQSMRFKSFRYFVEKHIFLLRISVVTRFTCTQFVFSFVSSSYCRFVHLMLMGKRVFSVLNCVRTAKYLNKQCRPYTHAEHTEYRIPNADLGMLDWWKMANGITYLASIASIASIAVSKIIGSMCRVADVCSIWIIVYAFCAGCYQI